MAPRTRRAALTSTVGNAANAVGRVLARAGSPDKKTPPADKAPAADDEKPSRSTKSLLKSILKALKRSDKDKEIASLRADLDDKFAGVDRKLVEQGVKLDDIQTEQKKARKTTEKIFDVGLWLNAKMTKGVSRVRDKQSEMSESMAFSFHLLRAYVVGTTWTVWNKHKMTESEIQKYDAKLTTICNDAEEGADRISREAAVEREKREAAERETDAAIDRMGVAALKHFDGSSL